MEKNIEKQIDNKGEEPQKFSVFSLIVILILIVFVIFLPEIKSFYDKFTTVEDAPAREVDVEPVKEDKEPVVVKEFVIGLSKAALRNIELEELIGSVSATSPYGTGLNIKKEGAIISFTYEEKTANFKHDSDTITAEIKPDDASRVFYEEIFHLLARNIVSLHEQSVEDLEYTLKSSSFKNYKANQGISHQEKNDKINFYIKTNVFFPLLDSTKAIITADDIGLKESLISSDFNLVKGDLIVEIKAEEKLIITIGQKNYINDLSYDSLENIIQAIYGDEELANYKTIIDRQNADIKKDIYNFEYLLSNNASKFLEYNVIRLTVDKKII